MLLLYVSMVIYHEKNNNSIIASILLLSMEAMAATGNASSAKDLIGNPFTTFNSLPDSTRNGIMLVLGLVFLGALIAVVIGL